MSKIKNKILVSSAGSGKTTGIVGKVKGNSDKSILVTTYTNKNVDEIISKFLEDKDFDFIPKNISIMSLYGFLLSHAVKPHQSTFFDSEKGRINSIDFKSKRPYTIPKNIRSYYLNKNNDIYVNYLTEFICGANKKSSGKIIERLEKIYDLIIVDEIQDIGGKYDLDFFKLLLKSKIEILLVGDHRQSILNTNTSSKGKKSETGSGIINRFEEWEKEGLCKLEYKNISHRCCQEVCNFSDKLFPDVEKTLSKRKENENEHQGIFIIEKNKESVLAYYAEYKKDKKNNEYKLLILRFDKNSDTLGLKALNIGLAKGQTCDRVILFFPEKDLRKFLETGISDFRLKTKSLLYVALTRARFSVLLVLDVDCISCDEVKRIRGAYDLRLFY